MSVLCIVAAGASDMEKRLEAIEQATLTTQQVTLNMEKIIQAGSERTRQASALSDPELTNLLTSLPRNILSWWPGLLHLSIEQYAGWPAFVQM